MQWKHQPAKPEVWKKPDDREVLVNGNNPESVAEAKKLGWRRKPGPKQVETETKTEE